MNIRQDDMNECKNSFILDVAIETDSVKMTVFYGNRSEDPSMDVLRRQF